MTSEVRGEMETRDEHTDACPETCACRQPQPRRYQPGQPFTGSFADALVMAIVDAEMQRLIPYAPPTTRPVGDEEPQTAGPSTSHGAEMDFRDGDSPRERDRE
jgi:hypothetical protein